MNDHELHQTVCFLNGKGKSHQLSERFQLVDLRPRLYQGDNQKVTVVLEVDYVMKDGDAPQARERFTTLVDFKHALGAFGAAKDKPL